MSHGAALPKGLEETVLAWKGSVRPLNMSTLSQMGREAGLPMEELGQTPGNQTAFTGVFLDQVRSRGLRVYRAPDLRQQVLNAVLVETSRGLRLAKEKGSKKIDGAVALAMAIYGAVSVPISGGDGGLPGIWL